MKASIAHGIRPSALVLGKDSKKGWSRWDTVLAKAYQRFLNELCQQCGMPKYICHNSDNRIQFRKAYDECEATKLSARIQGENSAKKEPDPMYGKRVYAEPYLTAEALEEGLEMSDFRRPYLKERMKMEAARAE